jgi:hypothetical protein
VLCDEAKSKMKESDKKIAKMCRVNKQSASREENMQENIDGNSSMR